MIGKNIVKNSLTIAFNVLYTKKKKIYPTYASKHNSNWEKQFFLLAISDGVGWYYIALKKYLHY